MLGTVDCPDCGEACEVKETKKGKPYYRCEACGTQHFYRMSEGITRLQRRIKRKVENEPADQQEKPQTAKPDKDPDSFGFGFFS